MGTRYQYHARVGLDVIDEREAKRLDWILAKAQTTTEDLTEWEECFVNDMTDRLEKYGRSLTVSEKQWDVLERICDKST